MSDMAEAEKIDEANLRVLRNLLQRELASCQYIPHSLFTGGEYRKRQVALSDGMVAVGGGKGTYSTAEEMIEQGKPVFPIDLPVGAIGEDGNGAVQLHQEMASDPESFLAYTHKRAINRLSLTRLSRGVNDVDGAARVVAEMFESEFEAHPGVGLREGAIRRFRTLAVAAPLFSAMSVVLKAFEFLHRSES